MKYLSIAGLLIFAAEATSARGSQDLFQQAKESLDRRLASISNKNPLAISRQLQADGAAICVDEGLEYQSCILKNCFALSCYTDSFNVVDDDDDLAESLVLDDDDDVTYDLCSQEAVEERCAPLKEQHADCCPECYVGAVEYTSCINAEIFQSFCPDLPACTIDDSIAPPAGATDEDEDSIVGDFSACDQLESAVTQCFLSNCPDEECGISEDNPLNSGEEIAFNQENCGTIEELVCGTLSLLGSCCGGACREFVDPLVRCDVEVNFGGLCPGIDCDLSTDNFGEAENQGDTGLSDVTPQETETPTSMETMIDYNATFQPSSTVAPTE